MSLIQRISTYAYLTVPSVGRGEVFSSIGEDTPFSDSQALNFSGIANAAIVVPVRPEAFGQTFTLALRIKPTTVGVASSYAMIYQGSGFYIRLNHDHGFRWLR